ncbi:MULTISPECIES: hypothetical protein [Salegentibacter]|jgi:hypothetical protein|uniref:Uncharacterized protein n=1 Tax=Salegentibacter agarivorans TaxID=345907 RepID=A0A1I2NDF6_9FLAO|nr:MULTISPECIES: hypothetical protein [Salegentibacter]APS39707.1 hypothetical protein AO058_12825 [Salegentibacter sp. T436]SFF99536.1 hypothetical protein SAMN04488033_11916 [Salegentibacter agarivorans]|tara:strand:+ start:1288 stop:1584 length:297 start_codon:yes stop_codon:yes gene_type:complete
MSKQEEKKKYDSDVTSEDKQALNKKGRSMNKGQDKELDREKPVDFTADNLDIPGSNQTAKNDRDELVDEENYRFNKRGTEKEKRDLDDIPDPDTTKDN